MDGAFVTYHNTQEIFGFQYIPLSVIDNCVYISPLIYVVRPVTFLVLLIHAMPSLRLLQVRKQRDGVVFSRYLPRLYVPNIRAYHQSFQ
jgi:hypothetical protein